MSTVSCTLFAYCTPSVFLFAACAVFAGSRFKYTDLDSARVFAAVCTAVVIAGAAARRA